VRNPWGRGEEWNGKWSDRDHKSWSTVGPSMLKRLGHDEGSSPTDPDGTWWMDVRDLYVRAERAQSSKNYLRNKRVTRAKRTQQRSVLLLRKRAAERASERSEHKKAYSSAAEAGERQRVCGGYRLASA
jgi:hypothetical protein